MRFIIFIIACILVVVGGSFCVLWTLQDIPVIVDQPFEVTVQSTDRYPSATPAVGVGMVCAGMVILCYLAFERMGS